MEENQTSKKLESLSSTFYGIGIILCLILLVCGIVVLIENPAGFIILLASFIVWLAFYLTAVLLSAFGELLSATQNIENHIESLTTKQTNQPKNEQ